MTYYAGLDVSLKETSICIVDERRRVVKESWVVSQPETIGTWLLAAGFDLHLAGLEAGSLAPALYDGLTEQGLPVVCLDARHLKNATTAMPVKTDRIDARNVASALQAGTGGSRAAATLCCDPCSARRRRSSSAGFAPGTG